MAGRHTSSLAAVQGRLRDGVHRQNRFLHDLRAVDGTGRGRGGGDGALAALGLVGVIRAVQVAVASPVNRNASGPIALETTGAYCATRSSRNVTEKTFLPTRHVYTRGFFSDISLSMFFLFLFSAWFYDGRETNET